MNLVRLNSGGIGFKFEVQQPGSTGTLTRLAAVISKSLDEGGTWSAPVPETRGRDLADLAIDWGCRLAEAMRRLQPGIIVAAEQTLGPPEVVV